MSIQTVPDVDWPRVVGELIQAGYTQARIAEECSCRQNTISDLMRGQTSEPRYSTGAALLRLHCAAKVAGHRPGAQ